jgi:hypothetical protein
MTKMIQIKDYQKQDGTKILFAKNKQEIYPLSMSEINYCEMEEKKKKLLSGNTINNSPINISLINTY